MEGVFPALIRSFLLLSRLLDGYLVTIGEKTISDHYSVLDASFAWGG